MSLDRRGGLSLYGQAFRPQPSGSVFSPRTLTVWFPKGMTLLGGKVKACSKAAMRSFREVDEANRCTQFAAGRLGSDDLVGWFAFAGPKQGDGRLVWLRTKASDGENNFAPGVDKGTIKMASGVYGTKLVLRYGGLNISSRFVEVGIGRLRETEKCPSGGWRFKVATVTAEGQDSLAFRPPCSGGGGPGKPGKGGV